MFERRRTSSRGYLIGTVIGGLIGAAGALLFAPEKGAVMRKQVAERFNQNNNAHKPTMSQTLLELGEEWSEDVEEIMKRTKQQQNSGQQEQKNTQPQLANLIQDALEDDEEF
ncbi:YtxH domain-containing protein [Halalkalibacter urbisdiaboli]|uniref:YtxH domain-containing protein n=1 Tax=Halalkalibacter urbisdiaboli TaxID=1960589 RepID=UPI000B43DE91|nr:YtxH domain-containing protein [Halalkalibacter urbisdiaboli]